LAINRKQSSILWDLFIVYLSKTMVEHIDENSGKRKKNCKKTGKNHRGKIINLEIGTIFIIIGTRAEFMKEKNTI